MLLQRSKFGKSPEGILAKFCDVVAGQHQSLNFSPILHGMKLRYAAALSFGTLFSGLIAAQSCMASAMPTGDAARGAILFASNCAACHSAAKGGGDGQGPNLYTVYGRKAGSEAGFPYSGGFAKQSFAWDDAHLNQWLTKPTSLIPGSYMMYQQPDPQIRADIIAYLKSLGHS